MTSPAHEPTADAPAITTPIVAGVILDCPKCHLTVQIAAKFSTRLVADQDGSGSLALRTRAPKTLHVCDQPTLGLVEGARVR